MYFRLPGFKTQMRRTSLFQNILISELISQIRFNIVVIICRK